MRRGPKRIHAAALCAAALALGLSACTESPHGFSSLAGKSGASGKVKLPKRYSVNTPFTGSVVALPGGTFTPSPDGQSVAIADRPYSGDYSVVLPTRAKVPVSPKSSKTFKVKALTGPYYTTISGTTFSSGTSQLNGVQVIKFSRAKLGVACVSFTTTVTDNGRNATGSFSLEGGTKVAKRMTFSGTFTQSSPAQPTGGSASPTTGTLTGEIRFNKKPRGLTPQCAALVGFLP